MPDTREEVMRKYPFMRELIPVLEAHNEESPRGKVLVCCAFLEEQMRHIVDAFLVEDADRKKLFEVFNAPIGTFAARITLAHALGLISDVEREDCNTLRKIRNEFAHSHGANFNNTKVAKLCKKLHYGTSAVDEPDADPASIFSAGATVLICYLINRPLHVRRYRLARRDWPQ